MTIYYLCVKTHASTGLKYLCQTKNENPHKYLGSGKYWRRHLRKNGYEHTTEIIRECNSKTEVKEWGIYYSDLWNVVESDDWANLMPENGGGGKTVEQPWNKGKRGAETKHFGMKYNMTESGRKSKQESGKKMFEKNFGNRTTEAWQTHYLNTLGKITPDQRREIGRKTGKKGGEKWSKASGNKVTVTDINGVSKRIPKDLFWQMKNAMIEHNIPVEQWEYVQVSSLESKKRRAKHNS